MSNNAVLTPSYGKDNLLRGVLLVLMALLFFVCNDTVTKYLGKTMPIAVIVFARYAVNLVLAVLYFAKTEGTGFLRANRTGLLLVRGACLATASLTIGLALQRMQIAETTAIVFLAPMIVVLLAGPLLGERVAKLDWLAAILGFAGVLLIARPGHNVDAIALIYMAICVAVSVGYNLLSRVLSKTESNGTMMFYSTLVGTIAFGLMMPWVYTGLPSTNVDRFLLLTLGALAGLGHFFFTAAYRVAPSSTLAPLQYLQMFYAGIFGWFIFGQWPDHYSLAGMFIIAVSGLIIAYKAKFARST